MLMQSQSYLLSAISHLEHMLLLARLRRRCTLLQAALLALCLLMGATGSVLLGATRVPEESFR